MMIAGYAMLVPDIACPPLGSRSRHPGTGSRAFLSAGHGIGAPHHVPDTRIGRYRIFSTTHRIAGSAYRVDGCANCVLQPKPRLLVHASLVYSSAYKPHMKHPTIAQTDHLNFGFPASRPVHVWLCCYLALVGHLLHQEPNQPISAPAPLLHTSPTEPIGRYRTPVEVPDSA
eukprot:1090113-Rhodomonas_salina.6